MKKLYKRVFLTTVTALALSATAGLTAQDAGSTPASIELYKIKSLWMGSTNAAGSTLDDIQNYSTLEANYQWYEGDFKRIQQGDKNSILGFYTEGNAIFPGFYASGFFSFQSQKEEDVMYKLGVTDPYRGMPYYTVDLLPSMWKNQFYNMGFRMATHKLPCGLAFGIGLTYDASSAAKQRDIRTANYVMKIEVRPGVTYTWDKHSFGADFSYYSFREEAQHTNAGSDDHYYYMMKGLGSSTPYYGGQKSLNYVGNNLGGAIQYALAGDNLRLLAEGSYDQKVEDLTSNYTSPQSEGTVKDEIWKAKLSFYTTGRLSSHITSEYIYRNIGGIEYVMDYTPDGGWEIASSSVRSSYKTNHASLHYALISNRDNEYSWLAEVSASYTKQDDNYLLPASKFRTENADLMAGFSKNLALCEGIGAKRLLLHAGFTYNFNLSGKYKYNGIYSENAPASIIMPRELYYLTRNYALIQTAATYSQRISSRTGLSIFAKGEFNHAKTRGKVYDHRSFFRFSLGCNF